MGVFDLDAAGQRTQDQQARLKSVNVGDLQARPMSGFLGGIGSGVMGGGARAAKALDILASAPVALYETATGQQGKYVDGWYKTVDNTLGSAVDYWTPDAKTTGTVGRTLGGFAEMALPLMAGGGNPTLLLASTETNTASELVNQGVDAPTAVKVGLAAGAANAVGFKLPFLGKTLASRLASGAVGNLAVGAGATEADRQLLAEYPELAKRYDATDLEARAVDVLSGLAFGGLAHVEMRPSERAAVATAADAKHYQHDTAPGLPADLAASVAHQDAMDLALKQLLAGEPVTVPASLAEARFVPRGTTAAPEVPAELKALDAARAATPEQQGAAALAAEPDTAVASVPDTGQPSPLSTENGAAPAAAEPAAQHPVVAAATEVAPQIKTPVSTGEYSADGAPITMTAEAVLTKAKADVAEARTFGKGILAAVNCLLQSGAA